MSNSVTTRIELLGKENFDTWKLQVEALLIKNDAWSYVVGEIKKPVIKTGNAESEEALKKWIREDSKARSDLILSISPSELKQIKHCKSSNEVWERLHEIYQSKGPARKASLLKRLITQKMVDGTDIRGHLDEFFDIVDKLLDMGISVNGDLLAIILLYSLPESFENFRCAIESRDDLPSPEALKIKIMEEFNARKARDTENAQNAMYVRKTFQQRDGKYRENYRKPQVSKPQLFFKFKCHRCRKVGHKAADCREKLKSKIEASKICAEQHKCEKEEIAFLQIGSNKKRNQNWCLDSGCTSHMSSQSENFQQMESITRPLNLANGKTTTIRGLGDFQLEVSDGENTKNLKLQKVMFVPDLHTNLMSVAKITDKGYDVKFTKDAAFIQNKNGQIISIADRNDDLYYIRRKTEKINLLLTKENELMNWHKKLGHINFNSLIQMVQKGEILGIKINEKGRDQICEVCIKAKHVQSPFPTCENQRSKELLEIVHSDVCGPISQSSVGGANYFVTFIDDKSRWCEVYFVKRKSEVFNVFKEYKAFAETQCGKRIKYLQTDNGTEYCNRQFDEYLKENGIKRRLTVPHTPQQNGIAERKNRTLIETARSLMIQSGAPQMFWAEAINTANYIRNRCASKSLSGSTAYKVWTGKQPNVSYFQIFGVKAFVLDKDPKRGKFNAKSKECTFLGYSRESKTYRLWSPSERKVIVSRDVKFTQDFNFGSKFEDAFIYAENELYNCKVKEIKADENSVEITLHDDKGDRIPIITDTIDADAVNITDTIDTEAVNIKVKRRRGRPKLVKGERGRPKKVYHYHTSHINKENPLGNRRNEEAGKSTDSEYEFANFAICQDPLSLAEALSGDDTEKWKLAVAQEYIAHVKNETWEIVDCPQNINLVSSRFVLTTKHDKMKNMEKKKARLVARGFTQRKGADYNETFAPVIRINSIRLLMALAVKNGWTVHQMDVVTAFLNGDLDERIYMEIPELFEENMKEISEHSTLHKKVRNKAQLWIRGLKKERPVCLLKRSLYGLKQAGRQWYHKLDSELRNLGLMRTSSDPCIYIKKLQSDTLVIAVYVDDLLLMSSNEDLIKEIKDKLATKFEMKDLGRIHNCLGIEFKQSEDRSKISMSQNKYAREVLRRFNMSECKPISTPLDANAKLHKENEILEKFTYPYQNLIGSLMYLAVSTRPDISYAVSMLSQFNNCYSQTHWTAAKRILRYIQNTLNYGLVFKKNDDKLIGYVDADWAASVDDRKSYTGYVFTMSGTSISWESRKQRTVALSSTEAEYMALSEAAKEAIFLRKLLKELGEDEIKLKIFNDNQGAQQLARNPVFHSRTKHIDVRHHFIREAVEEGKIEIAYMPTEIMPADFLTKPLCGPKHNKCIQNLGLMEI